MSPAKDCNGLMAVPSGQSLETLLLKLLFLLPVQHIFFFFFLVDIQRDFQSCQSDTFSHKLQYSNEKLSVKKITIYLLYCSALITEVDTISRLPVYKDFHI